MKTQIQVEDSQVPEISDWRDHPVIITTSIKKTKNEAVHFNDDFQGETIINEKYKVHKLLGSGSSAKAKLVEEISDTSMGKYSKLKVSSYTA